LLAKGKDPMRLKKGEGKGSGRKRGPTLCGLGWLPSKPNHQRKQTLIKREKEERQGCVGGKEKRKKRVDGAAPGYNQKLTNMRKNSTPKREFGRKKTPVDKRGRPRRRLTKKTNGEER